jgi:hypothetical protein
MKLPERILMPEELIPLIFTNNWDEPLVKFSFAVYGVSQKQIYMDSNICGLVDINGPIFQEIEDLVIKQNFSNGDDENYDFEAESSDFIDVLRTKFGQLRLTFDFIGVNLYTSRRKTVKVYVYYDIVDYKLVFVRYEFK